MIIIKILMVNVGSFFFWSELRSSNFLLGYRSMCKLLREKYHLLVKRLAYLLY